MDEMKIESKFMKGVFAHLLKTMIKKKSGYDVDIQVNDLNVVVIDGDARIHMNADARLNNKDFKKLVFNLGK